MGKKTEMVRFLVPAETAAEYKAAADRAGWTLSLWIRQALKDELEDEELAATVPSSSHNVATQKEVPSRVVCDCGPALKKMGHAPVCPEHRAR